MRPGRLAGRFQASLVDLTPDPVDVVASLPREIFLVPIEEAPQVIHGDPASPVLRFLGIEVLLGVQEVGVHQGGEEKAQEKLGRCRVEPRVLGRSELGQRLKVGQQLPRPIQRCCHG